MGTAGSSGEDESDHGWNHKWTERALCPLRKLVACVSLFFYCFHSLIERIYLGLFMKLVQFLFTSFIFFIDPYLLISYEPTTTQRMTNVKKKGQDTWIFFILDIFFDY
jgi:hypothetical protein